MSNHQDFSQFIADVCLCIVDGDISLSFTPNATYYQTAQVLSTAQVLELLGYGCGNQSQNQ
jgi:hypothetical protein